MKAIIIRKFNLLSNNIISAMSTKRLRRKIGVKKRKKTVKRKNKGVKTRKNRKNCKLIGGNDDCSICLSEIDSNMVTTECKHSFCKNCLIDVCKMSEDPRCPMCRRVIKDTCKKIMPFDSREIFRYTNLAGADEKRLNDSLEKIREIIYNENFNINVENERGKSILYVLSTDIYSRHHFTKFVEYLLNKDEINWEKDIGDIIAKLNGFKDRLGSMIEVYKKHTKIPKKLKKLIN